MLNLVFVLVGGALGSLARYGVSVGARQLWPASEWPVGTFFANLSGGLLMGILMGLLLGPLKAAVDTERMRLLFGVGVLGGYTTFSSFSLETVVMLERRQYVMAISYAVLSALLAIGAAALGLFLIRKVAAA